MMDEEQRLQISGFDGINQPREQKFKPLEGEDDPIGRLPHDVIGNILGRLDLKEAVQTSLLSRRWRYRWCSACGLSFCFEQTLEDFPSFAKLVEHVLSLISGTIGHFSISLDRYLIKNKPNEHEVAQINSWLVQAVRRGATSLQFITSCGASKLPLSGDLFSCFQGLELLELYDCEIKLPDRSARLLFRRLVSLSLIACTFEEDGLQRLLDMCPNLRLLCAYQHRGLGNLHIILPNLEEIRLFGSTTDNISFNCCPYLKIIHVDMCLPGDKNNTVDLGPSLGILDLIHGTWKFIQSLKLGRYTLKKLSMSYVPHKLGWQLECLKYMTLDMDLGSMREVSVVLCLLRSSCILERLIIIVDKKFTKDDELYRFWETPEPFDCSLDQLTFLVVNNLRLEYLHLEFCRFLLAKTPILETFYAEALTDCTYGKREIIRNLQSYQEIASARVCIS